MNTGTGETRRFRRPGSIRLRTALAHSILTVSLFAATHAGAAALERFSYSEPHMGTLMHITVFAEDEPTAAAAAQAGFDRIAELNGRLSDYDPESELMRLVRQPAGKPVNVSDDLFEVLFRAQELAARSNGAFDVTMGPLVQLWRKARREHEKPNADAIAAAKKRVGYQSLHLNVAERTVTLARPNMKLDLGGIAKGYAADEALQVLRARGLPRALIAAAGDIAAGDPPPGSEGWTIGIDSIDRGRSEMTNTVTLRNTAISTSGDTEQFVEIDGVRYSHIVDPDTGFGLTERIAVTILAPDATTSDSLATLVSVLGAEEGLALVESLPGVEALIVQATEAGTESVTSSGFPQ